MPQLSKKWSFRLLAITASLLPFCLIELGLRRIGPPAIPPVNENPFVEISQLEPLFQEKPDEPHTLWIPESRLNLFRPAEFKRDKQKQLRVFALGGSTTQGEPYSTETAFPEWTGVSLARATGKQVEVINCGGLSYASYRVLAILSEVIEYDPDLILIYTGHNEFLEERSYESTHGNFSSSAKSIGRNIYIVRWLAHWLSNRSATSSEQRQVKTQTVLSKEVDALLDYQGGLEDYHRADDWHADITAHFQWNLEQMSEVCKVAEVPVLFISPVSNLADCPPFKFESSAELGENELQYFEASWDSAVRSSTPELAKAHVTEALELDPDHAGANYLAGKLAYEASNYTDAIQYFARARDLDVCPLRATSDLVQAMRETCDQQTLLDADALFREQSKHGIVGDEWLVDHIHPSVAGHQMLGREIAGLVLKQSWFEIENEDWEINLDQAFAGRLEQLGEEYFLRAKQRLEGLQLWTQGRAKKVRQPNPEN